MSSSKADQDRTVPNDPGVPELAETAVVPQADPLLTASSLALLGKDPVKTAGTYLPMETLKAINRTAWPLSYYLTEQQAFGTSCPSGGIN